MSSLFPVKAGEIANQLRLIPEFIAAKRKDCMGHGIIPDTDTHYLIVLAHPSIQRVVKSALEMKDFRLRLSIPKAGSGFSMEMNLNIYDANGLLLLSSTPVGELSMEISLAVEAELYTLLLESKGIKISQY